MSPRIEKLLEKLKEIYSGLTGLQRLGIAIVLGVLLVVFLGTVGVKRKTGAPEPVEFKPYRPERPVVSKGNIPGQVGVSREGEFPRPPGPGVEVTILEELKGLKDQIGELRTSIVNRLESEEAGNNEKVAAALSELHDGMKQMSVDLRAVKEKLKRDEQALKEQAPIELIAVISAGGFHYAVLRTEAGEKRVTEGDRVGPWMVEEIKGREVRLSTSSQQRVLTVK